MSSLGVSSWQRQRLMASTLLVTLVVCGTVGARSATAQPTPAAATPAQVASDLSLWELDVPDYPGLLAAAGLPAGLERARSLIELTRILHRAPGDYDTQAKLTQARVLNHLRLAAGRPTTSIPSPLPPRVWRELLPTVVDDRDLLAALVTSRDASLMYVGLMSVDRDTREYLAGQRRLVQQLARLNAGAVAAFAQALVVRKGKVIVAGGPEAEPLWSALANTDATNPERFIPVLFSLDAGRLAYLYRTVAGSDVPHQRFLLESARGATAERVAAFRATYALVAATDHAWEPQLRPFSAATLDFESVVRAVAVDGQGRPRGPLTSQFWDSVFAVSEPSVQTDGIITPAWLASRVVMSDRQSRRDRYESLLFAQRVFEGVEGGVGDSLVDVFRTFARYRALYLTLERIGLRDPGLYRAAAQRVARLRADGSDEAFIEHALFQGALAFIERATFFRTLDSSAAAPLVRSLCELDVPAGRSYRQAALTWLSQRLAPALAARVGSPAERLDETLLRGLAGATLDRTPTELTYEGVAYRVDPAGAELVRLQRVRDQQAAMRLEPVAQFSERLAALAAGAQRADSVQQNVRALVALLDDLREELRGLERGVRHADALREDADDAGRVLLALTKDPSAASAASLRTLHRFVDRAAADAILGWVYATAIGDPQGAPIAGGDVSRRHDFGLRGTTDDQRGIGAWSLPVENNNRNRTWRALGSLLGLDLAFARLALRRLDGEYPSQPPALAGYERLTMAQASALRSAFELTDADRDRIASAVARGRTRVAALVPQTLGQVEDVARELRMDGWRRTAVAWSVARDHGATRSLFTLTEEYWLGRDGQEPRLDRWGASALPSTGCWCLVFPEPQGWGTVTGRPGTGLLTTRFADVAIVAALALADLKLPAALGQGLAAMLTQTAIDFSRQSHLDDLVSLSGAVRQLTRADFEDYVATLTYDGPLRPAREPEGSTPPEPRP